MVEISLLATAILYKSIKEAGIQNKKGLRLAKKNDSFSLDLDSASSDDRVIYYNSTPVLIINRELDKSLDNYLINIGCNAGVFDLMISSRKMNRDNRSNTVNPVHIKFKKDKRK